jgi:TolB-like protein
MLRLTLFGGFSAAGADGAEIPLKSLKARALLAYLALPPGKPRSREEIMALLWSDRGEAQARASLRQVLTGLRKDLGAQAMTALNIADDAVSLDPDKVMVEGIKAGEELLAGFHLHDPAFEEWLRDERLRLEDTPKPGDRPDRLSLHDKPSVAVLPFTNMSGDPEQEYFSDGITEDIIAELSRFRELTVIARHSCFYYKDKSSKVREIGEELGVQYVVEGSVLRSGERVRVTVQLIEVANEAHIWAERYERNLGDVLTVQDEVTRAIVSMLAGRVIAQSQTRAAHLAARNCHAYDYVLRGEAIISETSDSNNRARDMYARALALDPECARAHAGLAGTLLLDWTSGWGDSPDKAFDVALVAAKNALMLDDTDIKT